ncbi:hypothetical protein B0T11DRAFT_113941 [Plectosphaerella cucumerina]|uniref:NACHT domain-containing protein n=1 Tax=Plectosphaerella cucumerina TaxID=40658 RepID=A0A8K0TCX1_9PEZI|nr:hypothetical protein B0T11DRAFT_113941 [Plectosphaerella cucumerina]
MDFKSEKTASGLSFESLAPTAKTLCDEAVDEFLAGLGPDDHKKNPFVRDVLARRRQPDAPDDHLEEMRRCIERLELKKKERKTYRILEKVSPFLEGLGRLTKTCESALQATPFGVSIAFSGVRIVLEAAVAVQGALTEVLEALEDIAPDLRCYELIAEAQAGSPDMAIAIKRAYRHVLEFWCLAAAALSRGYAVATASAIIKSLRPVVQTFRDRIRQDSRHVQDLLAASLATQGTDTRLKQIRRDIAQWIGGASKDGGLLDHEQDLRARRQRRTGGTCRWMFERPEFTAWRDAKEDAALWYHAPPGTGKSVLASAVVDHLRSREPGAQVACFFYTFSEGTKRRGLAGLRSLALQLLRASAYTPDGVVLEYTRAQQQLRYDLEGGNADVHDAVRRVLHIFLDQCPHVYIVLDGLDECLEEDGLFFGTLEALLGARTNGTAKWFFSSCDVGPMRRSMRRVGAVEVRADFDAIADDVRAYLQAEDICMVHADDWIDPGEQNFLYARLRCEIVKGRGYTSREEIRAALREFPRGLDSCYVKILERIAGRSVSEQNLARRVFRILIASEKPVTVDELLNALAIRPDASDHSPDRAPLGGLNMVEDVCGPLITREVSKNGEVVKLYHKSVRDFLLATDTAVEPRLRSFLVDEDEAETEIGLGCLTYLQYERYAQPLDLSAALDTKARDHAFLRYAACFWHAHLWSARPNPPVVAAVEAFLQSPAFWTCIYVQAHTARYLFARYNRERGTSSFIPTMGRARDAASLFALPLPRWMTGREGPSGSLDSSFCAFVQDWGELLTKSPDHLAMAVPLTLFRPGCGLTPPGGKALIRARYTSKLLGQLPDLIVTDASFVGKKGSTLQLRIIRQEGKSPDLRAKVFRVSVFPKAKVLAESVHPMTPGEGWLNTLVRGELGEDLVQAWRVDTATLGVRRAFQGQSSECLVKEGVPGLGMSGEGRWRLVQMTVATGSEGSTRVFHLRWVPKEDYECRCGGTKAAEEVEGDEDEDSASDSDSDSDSDSESDSDSDSDTSAVDTSDADDTEHTSEADHRPHRDCLVVAADFGPPVWRAIRTDHSLWSRIVGARHPALPVVAVSHRPGEVVVFDDEAGTSCSVDIPEAKRKGTPPAHTRELQFSPCGGFVHLLSVELTPTAMHTECHVVLSTYRFTRESPSSYTFEASGTPVDFTYRFAEMLTTLPAPFVMTYWTPEAVVVSLPPLTYNPRIVRIGLEAEHGVTTPTGPIFFPASTAWRRPHLMYGGGSLYLILDASSTGGGTMCVVQSRCGRPGCKNVREVKGEEKQEGGKQDGGKQQAVVSPPVVLRWKMTKDKEEADGEDDTLAWRTWNQEEDGRSEDVKVGRSEAEELRMLRGDFVGAKKYHVPYRSGLDWTRQGVLSCA